MSDDDKNEPINDLPEEGPDEDGDENEINFDDLEDIPEDDEWLSGDDEDEFDEDEDYDGDDFGMTQLPQEEISAIGNDDVQVKGVNVYLIGTGLIGSTLIRLIKENREMLRERYALNVRILGIANSKRMHFLEAGIDLDRWEEIIADGESEVDLVEFVEEAEALQLDAINPFSEGIVVDCTASDRVTEFYHQALESELHVVTANKKAASGDFEIFQEMLDAEREYEVKFLYETNVGAGLPVISTLRDLVRTGDEIVKIEAVLSGTLSYIFNNFKSGMKFSQVVAAAQDKGYTEPDPREDLNGMDVARKILILAREVGSTKELKDVEVENLVPESGRNVESVEDFYKELAKADEEFGKKVEEAEAAGKRLRYIATYENGVAKVSLQAVAEDHPFYNLSGSDNIVSFRTKRYSETPLVVKGPGAGAEVTAAGVFADILRVA